MVFESWKGKESMVFVRVSLSARISDGSSRGTHEGTSVCSLSEGAGSCDQQQHQGIDTTCLRKEWFLTNLTFS
jgi:hypothetical protein